MLEPDAHLVELVGFGKHFGRGPEAGESQWVCSVVVKSNGDIGVVPDGGWRQNEFGYPEILVVETGFENGWRDEFWFQGVEASVAWGVVSVDGVHGRNAFDHKAVVEVWTYDVNTCLDVDVDDARVVAHDGEVLDSAVPLREALVEAGILSEARLGPDLDSDLEEGGGSSSSGSGDSAEDEDPADDEGSGCDEDGGSDSGVDGSGDGEGSAVDEGSGDDEGLAEDEGDDESECEACGACWRDGERCRSDCEGGAGGSGDSEGTEV